MQREGKFCGWCQSINPRTSHWRVGDKRFCSKAHRQAFLDHLEDDPIFEKGAHEVKETVGQWGMSPRKRRDV